jgi:hypothetical protein
MEKALAMEKRSAPQKNFALGSSILPEIASRQ